MDKIEKDLYIDLDVAEEHRLKGNDFFTSQKFVEAKEQYDEGVKRSGGKDHKIYQNRAQCLMKLMAHPDAVKDLEECLKLEPSFIKQHIRKGQCHFQMKDYNKALKAYEQGLKYDMNNQELKQGLMNVQMILFRGGSDGSGGADGKPDQQRVQEAMKDPEIQSILKDPQVNLILGQLSDPKQQKNAQEALKDPKIAEAIQKLALAGVIRLG